jgi:hypothetical protein
MIEKTKVIALLTDTIVAAAAAIEHVNTDKGNDAERTIKSAYYGLDNALTIIRKELSPAPRDG